MAIILEKGTFKATGATVYYEVKGAGENVFMIHAGIADSRMWDAEFEELTKNYRVARIDIPGFGDSDFLRGAFSFTKVFQEVLDFLQMEKVHIIAASYGGKLAIDFCLEHSARCKSLVLISPALSGWEHSEFLQNYGAKEDQLLEEGRLEEAALLNYETWIVRGREKQEVSENLQKLILEMQMTAFLKEEPTRIDLIRAEDHVNKLGKLSLQVLVLIGELDVPDFQEIADFICEEAPNAAKIMVPNAAHLANLEAPTFVLQTIKTFLQKETSRK
ncbi:alpha/beta fold hydrolase [Paenisporosarcina cavernae]|uniref:Alpha/beta hydrolase n=1 Tax=Paenisporosarcina cavernae TaxID=2320858 RepID=A0A385YR21_9BACL|nr:alpha/beta hydrolase [Paenisporosarcina cavernae]AYC28447.1 alpha/beta hydrolase [Paenisporosarcina cavernae]